MMKSLRMCAVAVLSAGATFMALSPAQAANLIDDGDFAVPNVGSGWGFFNNGSVGQWTNTNGDAIEVGNSAIYGLPCFSGSVCQNLEVNANTFDTVSQTLTGLVVGQTYNLSWAYGGRTGGGPQALNVSFGGTLLTQNTGSLGAWTINAFSVLATSSSETLTFSALDLGGLPSYGNEITNVSFSAVPEPMSWAMMLLGFGGLGAVVRNRRKQQAVSA